MTKKISLITCGLLLTTNMAFAADSIDEAFKTGTVSGDITGYSLKQDNKGGTKDGKLTALTGGLSYETASFMNLSAKASFRAGHVFDGTKFNNDSLMTEAYVKYAQDAFSISVGRQAIDLEWLGDYNESVVAAITPTADTSIVLGYVNQQAAADEDEIGKFDEITEDGAYVLDLKYTGIKNVELNPYFYSAVDVAEFYGLKASYSSDMFGAVAQYAASSEDVSTKKDGSIAHIELSTSIAGLSLATGYIKTDKDAGTASISAYGDNISPFDNGANTYSADAKTVYGSVGYSISALELGALYGETDFSVNSEEKELNLTASYSISDNLGLGLLYVDYDLEGSSSSDYKALSATASYTF